MPIINLITEASAGTVMERVCSHMNDIGAFPDHHLQQDMEKVAPLKENEVESGSSFSSLPSAGRT